MIGDFVSLAHAREAALAVRRGVVWAGMLGVEVAGIVAVLAGGGVLVQPDANNKALAVVAKMAEAGSCNGSDPLVFARSVFVAVLLAGLWAFCWSNRKSMALRTARVAKSGGER